MLRCETRVEPLTEHLPGVTVLGDEGSRADEVFERGHGGGLGHAVRMGFGGAGDLLGDLVAGDDGHWVADGPEIDHEDGRVGEFLRHLEEGVVGGLVWVRSRLHELVKGLQVAPYQGGLDLGEVCISLESVCAEAVVYVDGR